MRNDRICQILREVDSSQNAEAGFETCKGHDAKQPPIPSGADPQPATQPQKPSEKPKPAGGSSTKGPGVFSRLVPEFLLPKFGF